MATGKSTNAKDTITNTNKNPSPTKIPVEFNNELNALGDPDCTANKISSLELSLELSRPLPNALWAICLDARASIFAIKVAKLFVSKIERTALVIKSKRIPIEIQGTDSAEIGDRENAPISIALLDVPAPVSIKATDVVKTPIASIPNRSRNEVRALRATRS
jgi:hypothetical protein